MILSYFYIFNRQKKLTALNIAEKPSVARKVTEFLSKNKFNQLSSISKYNSIFNFNYTIDKTDYNMKFTSVLGHAMYYEFASGNEKWKLEEIKNLYNTSMKKSIIPTSIDAVKNIKAQGK